MTLILRLLVWLGLPSWVAPLFVASVAVSIVGGAYIKGRMDSSASCREAELLAVIASMKRDQKIAADANEGAAAQIAALQKDARQADEEIAKYEDELRKRADRCHLTPDDVNRLRRIRG